jgi:hypothetical protein
MEGQNIVNRPVDRGEDSHPLAASDDVAAEPLDLEPVALLQVLVHGGGHDRRKPITEYELFLGEVGIQADALGAANLNHFLHRIQEQATALGVGQDGPDGFADGGRGAGQTDQENELFPLGTLNVQADGRFNRACPAGVQEGLGAPGGPTIGSAESRSSSPPGWRAALAQVRLGRTVRKGEGP